VCSFHHRPDPQHRPNGRLEAAYHRAVAPSSDPTPAFVPAIVDNEPSPAAPVLPAVVAMGASGVAPAPIEIAPGGVIVRVRGEADPRALTTVLKALRGRV
jgi:hypothetical protein